MERRVVALPVLDIEGATRHLGIRREDVLELVKMFLQDASSWRECLQQPECNSGGLRASAHRLKGEAANIGAQALRAAACNLEQAIVYEHDSAAVEQLRMQLLEEFEVFIRHAELVSHS